MSIDQKALHPYKRKIRRSTKESKSRLYDSIYRRNISVFMCYSIGFFILTSRYINKVHILNPSSLLEFFLFVCSKIGLCCLLIYSHFITNSESPLKTSLHIRNAIASSIAMSKVSYSARLFVQGKQRRYERRWTWAERLRDPCSGAINLHRSIEVKLPRGFGDANKILIFVQKLISEV